MDQRATTSSGPTSVTKANVNGKRDGERQDALGSLTATRILSPAVPAQRFELPKERGQEASPKQPWVPTYPERASEFPKQANSVTLRVGYASS